MDRKKIVILSLSVSMLLLTLTCGALVRATPEEKRTVYEMDCLGFQLSIVAPYLADPGDNITVTVTAQTSGGSVEYIHISIHGLKNETEEISQPLKDIHITSDLVPYQDNHTITIPNETAPGLLYGLIEWGKWSVQFPGGEMKIDAPPSSGFVVTYVRNLELEELQVAYEGLLSNYTKLESYESELGSTRNVMYILVATTGVSAATVVILLLRRPKRPWT